MSESDEVPLKSLRDRPFELLAELERRGRAVSAQVSQEAHDGREWVGVALRMAGDLYLVAREETREVLGVPPSTTRVPGAKTWIRGLANVRGQLLPIIDLRQFLGSGVTPVTRNTRIVVVNHREIPAGLLVDEVLGFRRFARDGVLRRCAADGGALRALPGRLLPPRAGAVAGPVPAHGAREPGVRGGSSVNERANARMPGTLAAMLACRAAADRERDGVLAGAVARQRLRARGCALRTGARCTRRSVRGCGGARALRARQKALEEAAASDPGAPYASDARFTRLMTNATTVLRARTTPGDVASAAAAQGAASAIAVDARALAQAAASGGTSAASTLPAWVPLALLAVGVLLLLGALVTALRCVPGWRASAGRRHAAQGERTQPAGDPAPAR